MYPTASAPQYAFGPSLAPMPMMAGGGLASLPTKHFQSGGGVMDQLFSPVVGVDVPGLGRVGPSIANMVGLAVPALSQPLGILGLVNTVVNAYQQHKSMQEQAEQIEAPEVSPVAPPAVQQVSPIAPVESREAQIAQAIANQAQVSPVAPPAVQEVSPIAPVTSIEAQIAAIQAQEQEDAANNAAVAAAAAAAANASETGAMDQGIGGIADAMGMGTDSGGVGSNSATDGSGGAGGDSGAGVGDGGGSSGGDGSTGGADSSASGGAGDAFRYGGRVMNYAQGGLPSLANNMASKGRYGDSMLVHMSPQEVQGLQRLAMANGTSLSVNPYTGMPEAFSLKKTLKKIAKFVAPILPFIPIPGLAGLSPLITKALLSTAVGGLSGKKGFDLKRGLMSGLTTYGIGSLAQGAGAAANANAGANIGDIGAQQAADSAISINAVPAGPDFAPGTMMDAVTGDVLPPTDAAATAASKFAEAMPEGSGFMDYVNQTGQNIKTAATGLYDTVTGAPGARAAFTSGQAINPFTDKPIGVGTAAGAAFTGVAGMKTLDELEKAKAEADKILQDVANRTEEEKAYARKILADYPVQYRRITGQEVSGFGMAMGGRITSYDDEMGRDDGMMQGGIAALAKGGLPPRYLRGGGDGMSDSIRANIEGKQEARLADGEFVIPADVVSHLGNGSSNAGAKRLYSMMDRVRKSRTGKTRQAPEVNTRRLMPA
jgi:uncharacterized membrane protein YgcG